MREIWPYCLGKIANCLMLIDFNSTFKVVMQPVIITFTAHSESSALAVKFNFNHLECHPLLFQLVLNPWMNCFWLWFVISDRKFCHQNFQKFFHKMEPHEKLHHLFHNLLRKLFAIIGHDIFREGEFAPYTFTYIIWAVFATFGLGIYQTLLYYDRDQVLGVLAFVGIALEVNGGRSDPHSILIIRVICLFICLPSLCWISW